MTESFLHYVWQHRRFDFMNALTTGGEQLNVLHPGLHNTDAGPDFFQATVEIGGVRWVGNVEIHVRASDWFRHGHQNDPKYRSVILHVVYVPDADVFIDGATALPVLVLKGLFDENMFNSYDSLVRHPDVLSCRACLEDVGPLTITSQMSAALVGRLLRRSDEFGRTLQQCAYDWDELVYRVIAKAFGCKTNSFAFEYLAQSLPYKILFKHKDSSLQLDALLFGVAGFLDDSDGSDYVDRLVSEYSYLRYKYGLVPIGSSCWNHLRLRPQNFPAIRIAQFSSLMHACGDSVSSVVLGARADALLKWLDVSPADYWRIHYRFGKTAPEHTVSLGVQTVNSIFINTIIPLRFMYARYTGDEDGQEEALSMFERFPFENNKLTRLCSGSLFEKKHAGDSQAILEQLREYCFPKRCLKCSIGERIVRGV